MNPATKIEYKQIQVCNYCGEPTIQATSHSSEHSWEGSTMCPDGCGSLEGERPEYKYECPICKNLLEEGEECSCEENANQYEPEED